MIDQLSKIEILVISETRLDVSKTIKCEICAVFKIHRLVQKLSAARITKSYEMLHFDFIRYEFRRFDDIICIAYSIDEFTHYSWVFSLTDHKKKIFLLVFRNLINRCDRSSIVINSMIKIIRSGQKTSIRTRLEDWIIDQNII